MEPIGVSNLLPADVVAQLTRAALTPITARDPLARVKAIEQAVKRAKRYYPHHFTELQA